MVGPVWRSSPSARTTRAGHSRKWSRRGWAPRVTMSSTLAPTPRTRLTIPTTRASWPTPSRRGPPSVASSCAAPASDVDRANQVPWVKPPRAWTPTWRGWRGDNDTNVLALGARSWGRGAIEACASGSRLFRRLPSRACVAKVPPSSARSMARMSRLLNVDPRSQGMLRETERQDRNWSWRVRELSLGGGPRRRLRVTEQVPEGYPGAGILGLRVVYAWRVAIARARELFGADHANVQPHSGARPTCGVFTRWAGDVVLGRSWRTEATSRREPANFRQLYTGSPTAFARPSGSTSTISGSGGQADRAGHLGRLGVRGPRLPRCRHRRGRAPHGGHRPPEGRPSGLHRRRSLADSSDHHAQDAARAPYVSGNVPRRALAEARPTLMPRRRAVDAQAGNGCLCRSVDRVMARHHADHVNAAGGGSALPGGIARSCGTDRTGS